MSNEFTLSELGQLVALFTRRGHLAIAQNYLDEMQAHIDAAVATEPNEILAELPMEETGEAMLKHRSERFPGIAATAEGPQPRPTKTLLEVAQETVSQPIIEPEPEGPPRDAEGNVTRISVKAGDRGYDPDVHENMELKILCDGVHITTAHTADTVAGTVWYHEKNAQGRIKTLEKHGTVEIRGL